MAKVIKGGRTRKGKDPLTSYGQYKTRTGNVRRAVHPEFYMHSWSNKVRRNREIFATAMEKYSKLDIVTKQAYTEVPFLRPIVPIDPFARWTIEKLRQRWREWKSKVTMPLPSWVPLPSGLIAPTPIPNPYISINPQLDPYKNLWRYSRGVGGHYQFLNDEMAKGHQRNPLRSPFPAEVPLPDNEPKSQQSPQRQPVYIIVDIDPENLEGKNWDLELWVYSEYTRARRWISSHKREVLIIVAIGALITFGYALYVGGLSVAGGTELLVTPTAEKVYALGGLLLPNMIIQKIKDSYYKHLVIKGLKKENIWGINMSRGWLCYVELLEAGNELLWIIYEGPDQEHKGKIAGYVRMLIDWENETAELSYECGQSNDDVWIYDGATLLVRCNPQPLPQFQVGLYNITKNNWGEARITKEGNTITYAFEDRPAFGDGDYNDAYIIVTLDDQGNVQTVKAVEGEHADALALYFNWQLIATFPERS